MKNEYRKFFAKCRKFVKMAYFLKKAGISETTFSIFMKSDSYDLLISVEKLRILDSLIRNELSEIVE